VNDRTESGMSGHSLGFKRSWPGNAVGRNLAAMEAVTEGRFSSGLPSLQLGQGPPLILASGLTAEHANPTGVWRRSSLSWAAPFAKHFTIYLVNRKPGLLPGATMADIAADYAATIEHDLGQPVLLHGTSTGGSVALQLAMDHPELIHRIVVAAAACRLSSQGRQVQAELMRDRERDPSRAGGHLPRQVPHTGGRLQSVGRHRPGLPDRLMTPHATSAPATERTPAYIDGLIPGDPAVYARLPKVHRDESRTQGTRPARADPVPPGGPDPQRAPRRVD